MRCPEETVHTRVNRALAKLRERLRRKGAVVSVAALVLLLERHACQAAFAGLAATIKCACGGKGLLSLAAVETADAVMSDFILAKVKLGTVAVTGLAAFAAFTFLYVVLSTPRTASTALKPAVAMPLKTESTTPLPAAISPKPETDYAAADPCPCVQAARQIGASKDDIDKITNLRNAALVALNKIDATSEYKAVASEYEKARKAGDKEALRRLKQK